MRLVLRLLGGDREVLHLDASEEDVWAQVARRAARHWGKPVIKLVAGGQALAPAAKVSEAGLEEGAELVAVALEDVPTAFQRRGVNELNLTGDKERDTTEIRARSTSSCGPLVLHWDQKSHTLPWAACSDVQSLRIGWYIEPSDIEGLVTGLRSLGNLRGLSLSFDHPPLESFHALLDSLPDTLEELHIGLNDEVLSDDPGSLLRCMRHFQWLRHVTWEFGPHTAPCTGVLVAALPAGVEELDLDLRDDDVDIEALIEALAQRPQLRSLQLFSGWEHLCRPELGRLIGSLPVDLEELVLDDPVVGLGWKCSDEIDAGLRRLTGLRHLEWPEDSLVSPAALAFLPSTRKTLQLRVPATVDVAQAVAHELPRLELSSATLAHVVGEPAPPEAWRLVVGALPGGLSSLSLALEDPDEQVVQAVAEAWGHLRQVSCWDLSGLRSSVQFAALLKSLPENGDLRVSLLDFEDEDVQKLPRILDAPQLDRLLSAGLRYQDPASSSLDLPARFAVGQARVQRFKTLLRSAS